MASNQQGRPAPHDEAAERALLGCILLKGLEGLDDARECGLEPDCFFVKPHRDVYEAILACDPNALDAIKVADILRRAGNLDDFASLEKLMDAAGGHVHNLRHYAIQLRDYRVRRSVIDFSKEAYRLAYKHDDPEKIVIDAESFLIHVNEKVRVAATKNDAVDALYAETQKPKEEIRDPGMASAFSGVNNAMLGYDGFTIVAARPSLGKTTLMLNEVDFQATKGYRPLVFSLETKTSRCVQRMAAAAARLTIHELRTLRMPKEKKDLYIRELARLRRADFWIEEGKLTVAEMRSKARRHRLKHGIGIVWIDYLQIIKAPRRGRRDDRNQEVSEICGELVGMMQELKVPVCCLSQLKRLPVILNRKTQTQHEPRPGLADLRDSGAIEQDADNVILLSKHKDEEDVTIADVAKQRDGPPMELYLKRDFKHMRFIDDPRAAQEEIPF